MKTKILILLTLISKSGFSQSIGHLIIDKVVTTNPIKIQFTVYKEDTVSMNIYNTWGNLILKVLPKDLYKAGTYKIEYTLADSFKTDTYIYQLKSSNKSLQGNVFFYGFKDSSKSMDFVKITCLDSITVYDTTKVSIIDTIKVYKTIKVNDSVKVSVFDTTKVLIMDTLNCIKTATNMRNYETLPSTESLVFHDNLIITFSGVDNLVLYDLSGKFICRFTINSNLIHLQDLKNGIYVGLFYENGDIVKTIKMIKE